jgi:hypothetical protein
MIRNKIASLEARLAQLEKKAGIFQNYGQLSPLNKMMVDLQEEGRQRKLETSSGSVEANYFLYKLFEKVELYSNYDLETKASRNADVLIATHSSDDTQNEIKISLKIDHWGKEVVSVFVRPERRPSSSFEVSINDSDLAKKIAKTLDIKLQEVMY